MVAYVLMAPEMSQQFDLSQTPLCQDFLAEDVRDLCDGGRALSSIDAMRMSSAI